MHALNQKSFDEKISQTRKLVPGPTLDAVRDFLLTAEDARLYNINPWRLAEERGVNRMATLKAMLHLTKAGLLNLYWTIHCPSCKGATQRTSTLQSLRHADHCDFCAIPFDAGFDTNLEVSFAPNPAVLKPGDVGPYGQVMAGFETEPGLSIDLDPGESHFLATELAPGNYFVTIEEDEKVFNIAVMGDKAPQVQKITLGYVPDQLPLVVSKARPGKVELVITNKTAHAREMRFTRISPPRWPSAAVVSSLQEFRDLFSSEMLSLDETFSIESLGFLFTDIKGSTELYERLGDAQAFALVKEHFYIMERIVKENNGGIVKTIGDAVMAVFVDPRDALHSAVEMIDAFDDLETARKLKNSIIIKVGVHHGPCIAVTLNERLDYFGTTVNIAARVQGLSDGRDIMASEALFVESDAGAYLASKSWVNAPFVTSLKGLKASYQVHKMHRSA
jgi:class 3 adenylate cyclase